MNVSKEQRSRFIDIFRRLAGGTTTDAFLREYSAFMAEIYPGYVDEPAVARLVNACLTALPPHTTRALMLRLASIHPDRLRAAIRAVKN